MFDPEGTYDILPQAREDIKSIALSQPTTKR